jgi:hypothetical protein
MTDVPYSLPAQGLTPTPEQVRSHLRHVQRVAERAVALGHRPFGAILAGPDQETVLLEQCDFNFQPRRVQAGTRGCHQLHAPRCCGHARSTRR